MPPAGLLAAATLVAIAAVLPVFYLLVKTLDGGSDAWNILARARTAEILGRTGLLIVTVTGFSILLAVPMAWLTTRTNMPFRRLLTVAATLPLVVPSYVMAMTVIEMFGPRGVLQQGLAGPFGLDSVPQVYGLPGATIVLVLISYPYVFLTVRGAILRLDPSTGRGRPQHGLRPHRGRVACDGSVAQPGNRSRGAARSALRAQRLRRGGADAVRDLHRGDLHAVRVVG